MSKPCSRNPNPNRMNNVIHSIQKVQNREMKQKPRQQSGLCDISYARYSDKRFTDFYTEALYGDAMLMSL